MNEALNAGRDSGTLHRYWLGMAAMGVALIVLGFLAIGASQVATLATMVVGGIFEIGTAVWAHCWRGFFLHLLTGILYLVAGVFLIDNPAVGAVGLTLF